MATAARTALQADGPRPTRAETWTCSLGIWCRCCGGPRDLKEGSHCVDAAARR